MDIREGVLTVIIPRSVDEVWPLRTRSRYEGLDDTEWWREDHDRRAVTFDREAE